ncbi:MAG: cytochrome c maturation protein CcmE [Phycisphaerales bacterium JB039]
MSGVKMKLIAGGLAIAAAVGYLGMTGVQSGWVYYLDVDEFVQSDAAQGKRTRVHGVVAEQGADVRPADLYARFDLLGESERLTVVYEGPVPDMFQTGREVVVEGASADGGVFEADILMTKCASKYEAKRDEHEAQVLSGQAALEQPGQREGLESAADGAAEGGR